MEKEIIQQLNKSFEEAAYEQDGIEYWLARELQELLGYADWRNFLNAVEKAKQSCSTIGQNFTDHFVEGTKMVRLGSGSERRIALMERLQARENEMIHMNRKTSFESYPTAILSS